MKFESVCVVGTGRVGSAMASRLERQVSTRSTGRELDCAGADLVLLCVPDRAISEVAGAVPSGPWIAHVSGASTLDSLEPHRRRFSLHPVQTFQRGLGPDQFDGAWAAISGESDVAREAGFDLAELLRVRPFELADSSRPLYHAGATVAATFLATLHETAAQLMGAAGAPPEAIDPLMRRTMENGFRQTGPQVRGDWETVERHLAAIRAACPELEPTYQALSDATAAQLAV